MKVTPGITLATMVGPVARADMDKLGKPLVEMEQSDIDAVVDAVEAALGSGIAGQNLLRNPDFSLWTRGLGPISLTEGVFTELADYWEARADYGAMGSGGSGSYATYALAVDVQHQQWLYCARLNGCVGLRGLDFGQQIPARVAASLHPTCTLTVEIENQTGTAFQPVVRMEACNAMENYSSMSLLVAEVLDSLPNGETKVYEITLDLSSYGAALRNGARLSVRFPAIASPAGYVKVYASKLESGSMATNRVTERRTDAISSVAAAAGEQINYLVNGSFHHWRSAQATCPEDVRTWGPLGWFVRPGDGDLLALSRDTVGPDVGSRFALKLTGGTDVTGTVDLGTQIDLPTASESRRQLIFTALLYNGTGAAIVPELRIDTCNGPNTFRAVTNRISQVLAPCADGAWSTLSYAVDSSVVTNWANGVEIYVQLPALCLDNAAKVVRLARPRLEPGAAASVFVPRPSLVEGPVSGGSWATLSSSSVTDTTLAIAATELVLKDAGGRALLLPTFQQTLSITSSGLNGLDYATPATASATHYLWVISDGEATAGLISTSASAPALPDGYRYRAMVGAIVLTSTSKVPRYEQRGREVWILSAAAQNGSATAADAWQELVLAMVPDNAIAASGSAGVNSAHNCRMRITGETGSIFVMQTLGEVIIQGSDVGASVYGFRYAGHWRVPLLTPRTIWWAANNNSPTYRIEVSGYTLP